MNSREINAYGNMLEMLLDKALLDTMDWVFWRCYAHGQEPDYVAALTTKFTHRLYHILKCFFPSTQFSISGVFCHQKPIVDIGCEKKPELGDLLLVYVDQDDSGARMYNALLLQAKMSASAVMKVKTNEQHQLALYQRWPEFVYYRAGSSLNGKKRNICPKTINDGAQYLLIDASPCTNGQYDDINKFPMGCAVPNQCLMIDDKFSREIINFLKFKSGRTFENHDAITEDWSQMIWDLLHMAFQSYSRRKNDRFPRETTYVHFGTVGKMEQDLLIQSRDMRKEQRNDDENIGVPVILIETQPANDYDDNMYL